MRNPFCLCLLISLTAVLTASAGTFSTDFNSGVPAGASLYGSALVDTTGGPDGSGCLKMTSAVASASAGFVIDNFDNGGAITAFTAAFQLVMGGGTATPADGFSFNFAPDLPDGAISEEGAGTGLTVEFDTYQNSTSDLIGIDVKWKGNEIATHPTNVNFICTWPTYTNVVIVLTNGALTVKMGTSTIYSNLALSGFSPMVGRFGLGARCGASDENCWLDNLTITTTPVTRPFVWSDSPTGTNIAPAPTISVVLCDGSSAQVDQTSVQVTLNGTVLNPATTSYTAPFTTNLYTAPTLPSGSTNTVVLSFADNGIPVVHTNVQFSFVVVTYPTLPASYAATAVTSQPGFTERIFQGGSATVSTVELADTMLAGLYYNTANGQLFPNLATTNTDGSWTFLQSGTINYSVGAPANAGDFTGDAQYPGMPGTTGSTNNFAYEAVTYLYLAAPGLYTLGINSDDGFRLTCLDKQVGIVDAGRGAADTLCYVAVNAPGYYPFRLVHFQGAGTGSLEWFSVDSSGTKTLINNTGSGGIPAYAAATTSLPYFLLASPYGTGNRPDKPIQVQMQDGVGIQVNTNAIHLLVNGVAVTPSVTQTGGVTTVQYNGTWASGSANTAMVWFADNEVAPISQTNQSTFSVSAYSTIPASYAISAGAVDTTKPGYQQKVFQTDRPVPYTIANAETMLAGQLVDPAGNPYPNKAATNTDGSYSFAQTNTINYNIAAPGTAGNFTNDVQFPGEPGVGGLTNTFALEAITYVYLPAGYYVLGVDSDDGFRLTTWPNPHEEFPYQLAVFDGTRSVAETTGVFAVTNAGYYPFRLVYFQAIGPASLELYAIAYTGARNLVNDTNNPASLRAYRSANNTLPYVQWAYPYRAPDYSVLAGIPVSFTLVDGTPAVQLSSIQMTFNGATVAPSVIRTNGTNIVVSYMPTPQTTNSTPTVQLVWADTSGHYNTNAFSFTFYGSEALAPLWSLPPGYRPYLTNDTTGAALEAGMAYNPVTGHLIVGSLLNTNTLRGFYILDALTGNDLGQLKQTNSSGVNVFSPLASGVSYPGYSVGVADDGAIYAASRVPAAGQKIAIYRWASETSVVYTALSPTVFNASLGYDFRVRGSGANTQIILGLGNSSAGYAYAMLYKTTDGSNFTATVVGPVTGVNADFYGGIAFGTNNTFYAQGFPSTVLEYVAFDSATKLAAYPLTAPSGSLGPIGVDLVNGRLIALATSTTAGTTHTVNLFDLNALTSSANTPTNSINVPTSNVNASGAGSVAITPAGDYAFVLDSQNGITAYELAVKATTVPLTAATTSIGVGPGSNYTIKYSDGQAINYVLLKSVTANAAMSTWTPVATNSGTLSSSNFVVTPSGTRTFYRVSSRGN